MGNNQNANFNPYKQYDASEQQNRRQAHLPDDRYSDSYRNIQSQQNASKSSQKSFEKPFEEEEKKSCKNTEIDKLENSEEIAVKNAANLAKPILKIRPPNKAEISQHSVPKPSNSIENPLDKQNIFEQNSFKEEFSPKKSEKFEKAPLENQKNAIIFMKNNIQFETIKNDQNPLRPKVPQNQNQVENPLKSIKNPPNNPNIAINNINQNPLKSKVPQNQVENPLKSIKNPPNNPKDPNIAANNIDQNPLKPKVPQNQVEKDPNIESLSIEKMVKEAMQNIEMKSKYLKEVFLRSDDKITYFFPEQGLITIETIDEVLDRVLRSEKSTFFKAHSEKLGYLYNCWLKSNEIHWFFIDDLKAKVQKKIYAYIFSLTLFPLAYGIEENEEKLENITDITDNMKSKFYNICFDYLNDDFLTGFFDHITTSYKDDEIFELMESVNKRIFFSFYECSLDKNKLALTTGMNFFRFLFEKPKFAQIFCEKSKVFLDKKSIVFGKDFEKFTIFGRYLSKLGFLPNLANTYYEKVFNKAEKMLKKERIQIMINIRDEINKPVELIKVVMEKIMKNGMKRQMLDWFLLVLEKNKERNKINNVNLFLNSSDDFMANLMRVALNLCVPFIENEEKMLSKLTKVDPFTIDYEKSGPFQRLECFNREKYLLTAADVVPKDPHFITEIYYITTFLIHVNQKIYKDFVEYERRINKLYKENPNFPEFSAMFSKELAIETFILDPLIVNNMIKLFGFTSLLVFSFLEIKYEPNGEILILDEEISDLRCSDKLARLPLFIAEDMIEYFFVIYPFCPELFLNNIKYFGFWCDFMLLVVTSKDLITNPHVRADFISCISYLLPLKGHIGGVLNEFQIILTDRPFFQEFLIDGLVEIFIDVEKIGFYEKFSYRREVCEIFSYILGDKTQLQFDFRKKFKFFLDRNCHKFLQFMFLFMNDLINRLDESLIKLKQIKEFEETENTIMNPIELEEKKIIYEANKISVSNSLLYLNSYYENLDFFGYVSSQTLILEEIREKLVNNMNYTLEELNGQKSVGLKVKNMKKLNFDPKFILQCLVHLYTNLSKYPVFLKSVIKDGRSFKEKTFEKTLKILIRENLLSPEEIKKFEKMIISLIKMKANEKEEEKALGEIPEEFLDPIINEIMEDPVMLPSSKVIVDRLTILKHLLSDSNDPFNRQHLTKEMLIPQDKLKKRIEEFRKEKLGKK